MADSSVRNALHSNIIRKIIQDHEGVLWIGTDGGGLSRYLPDQDQFMSFYYRHEGLDDEQKVCGDSVKALFEDSEYRLWVGFESAGLALFDPLHREFTPVELLEDPSVDVSVRSIREDASGTLWVGTDGNGLFIIKDPGTEQAQVTHIEQSDQRQFGLSNDRIREILIDRTGLIWIGMRDGGINLFNPLSLAFSRITKNSTEGFALSSDQIKEITEAGDRAIWVATDGGGLNRIDPLTMEITRPVSLSDTGEEETFSLLADGDYLWIGTDGDGLYRYDVMRQKVVRHYLAQDDSKLSSNVIWDLFKDSHGTLWVGTENGGLHAFDRQREQFVSYRFDTDDPSSMLGNSVREIFEDREGNLWIGTWDGGLNRFISEELGFERFSLIPGDTTSLSDSSVNTIFEDAAGTLWIGTTGGGINRFDPVSRTFSAFRQQDGLASDNVYGILEDDRGYFWITTDNGLSRFDPEAGRAVNFIREDGLPGNDFSQKAYFKASDGRFFLGGGDGLVHFYPQDIEPRSVDSPFLITGLRLQNKDVTVGPLVLEDSETRSLLDRPLYENPTITLAPSDRFITFSFALFDFVNPQRNLYAVKLDGLDDTWTDLGSKNSITFATIPPGSYNLRIRATHYNGLVHPIEQSIAIEVNKHFYQQWYFLLSLLVFTAALVFLIFKLRVRALHAKNAELRRYSVYIQEAREKKGKTIAREIHDQLGQILTLLKFDMYRIRKQLKEEQLASEQLMGQTDTVLETLDAALDSVKTISTRLRPSALDSLSLSEALQWQAMEFQRRTSIQVTLEIAKESHQISEEISLTLFRVLQEMLTNIIRHAKATEVTITFHENDTSYYLQVADNGVGCTTREIRSKTSFGMISIRERCEALGGTMRINSPAMGGKTAIQERQRDGLRSTGTRIELLIPIPPAVKERQT